MREREGAKEGVGVVAVGVDAYVLPALVMLEEEGNGGNQV